MSQISKAIEIAKREGQFNKARNTQTTSASAQSKEIPLLDELDSICEKKFASSNEVLRKNRVLSAIDDSIITDTYRLLRTRILRRMDQNKWRSIGITSAGQNAGKTLTAVNLGVSIAMKQNYSVIVVDTDLRNPSIHKLFGVDPKFGLNDYLSRNTPLDEILLKPDIDGLYILPGTQKLNNSSELLSSAKMTRLCEQLKNRHPRRIVIYDLPPVLIGDDVMAFSPNTDCMLLVVEEGSTETDKLRRSVELLEETEIIGAVLNKSKETSQVLDYYY